MNARWRIIGPEVVAKREQVELYYRAAITNVMDPYNITMRFFNYTSYPAVTSGKGYWHGTLLSLYHRSMTSCATPPPSL